MPSPYWTIIICLHHHTEQLYSYTITLNNNRIYTASRWTIITFTPSHLDKFHIHTPPHWTITIQNYFYTHTLFIQHHTGQILYSYTTHWTITIQNDFYIHTIFINHHTGRFPYLYTITILDNYHTGQFPYSCHSHTPSCWMISTIHPPSYWMTNIFKLVLAY